MTKHTQHTFVIVVVVVVALPQSAAALIAVGAHTECSRLKIGLGWDQVQDARRNHLGLRIRFYVHGAGLHTKPKRTGMARNFASFGTSWNICVTRSQISGDSLIKYIYKSTHPGEPAVAVGGMAFNIVWLTEQEGMTWTREQLLFQKEKPIAALSSIKRSSWTNLAKLPEFNSTQQGLPLTLLLYSIKMHRLNRPFF